MNAPRQVLERLVERAKLMPGLSDVEIRRFQDRLGRPLPAEIGDLLKFAAGFEFPLRLPHLSEGRIRFTGTDLFACPGDAVPCPIDVMEDGCGNFWVVDVDAATGDWGVIMFVCHDPPVIAIQAPDLAEFIVQALDPSTTTPRDALRYISGTAVMTIWRDEPYLISKDQARASPDPMAAALADSLPQGFSLFDLRSIEIGSGFRWGLSDPDTEIRRAGRALLFGLQQKEPGFFERLLSRRKRQKELPFVGTKS